MFVCVCAGAFAPAKDSGAGYNYKQQQYTVFSLALYPDLLPGSIYKCPSSSVLCIHYKHPCAWNVSEPADWSPQDGDPESGPHKEFQAAVSNLLGRSEVTQNELSKVNRTSAGTSGGDTGD